MLPPRIMRSAWSRMVALSAAYLDMARELLHHDGLGWGLLPGGIRAWGRQERWLRPLARRLLTAFVEQPTRRTPEEVAAFIEADSGFHRGWLHHCRKQHLPLSRLFWVTPAMSPAAGPPA